MSTSEEWMSQEERTAAEQVERIIRDAFANAQYPGDENLVNNDQHWEGADVKAHLKGKHWSELTLHLLRNGSGMVWYLTPEAFRFYIPAFLIVSLSHLGDPDMAYESTLNTLTPPPRGIGSEAEFAERVQGFTTAQRAAIKAALENYKSWDEDAADSLPAYALENYWNAASSSS